jgi:indolepyruvate ferredoxin oxidoreductase alpha subunit
VEAVREWAEKSSYNAESGIGRLGLVAGGFVYTKLLEVLGDEIDERYHLLKLGVLYPAPKQKIAKFLKSCHEVLVFEENEPFIETCIKAVAQEAGLSTRICGKVGRHVSREGELFRWQIQETLSSFLPKFKAATKYSRSLEKQERPRKKDHCADCQYDKILDKLEAAAASLGQKPFLIGDPGCLVTVADRLDAKYAIGSAVSVADGLSKAGIKERAVAIFGDSAFFHSALPALCNAVHNRSSILMIVLDNQATATSGFQPHPGVARDALGNEVPGLNIEGIARACGINSVYSCGPHDLEENLENTFRKSLSHPELTLCIVRMGKK